MAFVHQDSDTVLHGCRNAIHRAPDLTAPGESLESFQQDGEREYQNQKELLHSRSKQGSCKAAIRLGTVSTGKSASYTHGSAMETFLSFERTNLASHAGRTDGIPLKNSADMLGELPRQGPLMKARIAQAKFTLSCLVGERSCGSRDD